MGHIHRHPPLTPASFLLPRRRLLFGLVLGFVLLGAAAALADGMLFWDGPLQRFVEANRTEWLDSFFLTVSRLGSTVTVLVLGLTAAAVTWRRCRAVSTVLVLATLSRPLLEFTVKVVVDRSRPDFERLVPGNGPSFPTGHVMAAVALWGLLPMVVALYTKRQSVWWASVWASGVLILAIGASRVYLGVHWFSDVVGGLLAGTFFLLGVEAVLSRQHRRHPCGQVTEPDE